MVSSQLFRWSLKASQETFQGRVVRITIYLQSKILEIIDSNDSVFYLIYFKNSLLGGGPLEQIEKNSFLYKAFQEGMKLESNHPLFPMLIPKSRKSIIPNPKSLFTQLQEHHTLQEIAIAATYMDSFIDKTQLVTIIREIFNHFRRNGQLLKAYQISKVLFDFTEDSKAVRALIRISEFDKYRKLEEVNPMALLEKDQIVMESFYYQHLHQMDYEIKLHRLYAEQNRHLDRLILFMHQYEATHDFYNYNEFRQLLQQLLKPEDQFTLLTFLHQSFPDHPRLIEDLLQEQIQLHFYSDALTLVTKLNPSSVDSHREQIEMMVEQMDPATLIQIEHINHLICTLYPTLPEKIEPLIRHLTTCLLKEREPAKVIEWLEPIHNVNPNLNVIEEIIELERLSNDLDQLQKLGEIYYKLGLLDQSIEAFTWEMELNPTSMEPVRWLSKLYQEKGMKEEADSYKKLSIMMSKGVNLS